MRDFFSACASAALQNNTSPESSSPAYVEKNTHVSDKLQGAQKRSVSWFLFNGHSTVF